MGFYYIYGAVHVLSVVVFFFLMIRRPPRSTLDRSSAASDVYKRQALAFGRQHSDILAQVLPRGSTQSHRRDAPHAERDRVALTLNDHNLSLIHISEPTRPY